MGSDGRIGKHTVCTYTRIMRSAAHSRHTHHASTLHPSRRLHPHCARHISNTLHKHKYTILHKHKHTTQHKSLHKTSTLHNTSTLHGTSHYTSTLHKHKHTTQHKSLHKNTHLQIVQCLDLRGLFTRQVGQLRSLASLGSRDTCSRRSLAITFASMSFSPFTRSLRCFKYPGSMHQAPR